ncbi:hypothetical protein GCM10017687_30590 [Streptomyces echinatus]
MLDHETVATVLADPATYSSDLSALAPTQSDFETFTQGNFVGMDPPEHRKLRTLVSQAFTPRVVHGLGPRIEAVCARLLDAVADRDRFDLVDALAYPLPIIVIAELLGIPAEEHRLFQEWASVLFGGDQLGEAPDMADLERALEAIAPTVREMNSYMLEHIRARRADPGDDLTSRLIAAEVDGVRLADQEMVGFVALLLVAGHITTTALLGNAVVTFDRHPGTDAALRSDPARIPAAVEEVLALAAALPGTGPPRDPARDPRRSRAAGGRPADGSPGRRQPRSRPLRRTGRPRHRPDSQSPSDLRARHPFLLRRAAGTAGGTDRPADVARTIPHPGDPLLRGHRLPEPGRHHRRTASARRGPQTVARARTAPPAGLAHTARSRAGPVHPHMRPTQRESPSHAVHHAHTLRPLPGRRPC